MRKERQGNAMKDEVQLEKEKNTMVREPEDIDLEEVLYAGDLSREYEPDKLQEEDDKDEEEQRQTGEHVHRQRPHRKRREHRLWVRILKKTSIFVGVVTVLTAVSYTHLDVYKRQLLSLRRSCLEGHRLYRRR